jgi:hypothetical protein
MQTIDPSPIGALASLVISIVACGATYGVIITKIERLERDVNKCVDRELFDATLQPLRDSIHSIKEDLSRILGILTQKMID